MSNIHESMTPKRMTASGSLAPADTPVALGGLFCTTGGTIQLRNGETVAGDIVVSTFTVVAGVYYPLPFQFPAGCYAEITTAVVTFGFIPN